MSECDTYSVTSCDCFFLCCEVSLFNIQAGQFSLYILGDIITIIMFLSLVFLLMKLFSNFMAVEKAINKLSSESQLYEENQDTDFSQKTLMLPIYYGYVLIMSLWFLLETVVVFFPLETRLVPTIAYQGHSMFDNLILVLAFFPRLSKRDIAISIVISSLIFLFAEGMALLFFHYFTCTVCSLFMQAAPWFWMFMFYAVAYGTIGAWTFAPPTWKIRPRTTVRNWALFLCFVNLSAGVGALLLYWPAIDIGWCVVNVADLAYVIAYAPLLYSTFRADSRYMREISDSSEYASLLGSQRTFDPNAHLARNSGKFKPGQGRTVDRRAEERAVKEAKKLIQGFPSIKFIDLGEVEVGKRIGAGGMGEIYYATWRGTPVALKRLFRDEQALADWIAEVKVLSKVSHPNVVLFMGVAVEPNGERYIITEYVNFGSLFHVIHSKEPEKELTPARQKRILYQTARGLAYLHGFNPSIIHRDLKSQNLLVDEHWNLKVADFGLSRDASQETMTATGTPQWSAPEVVRHERYSIKADVYSFGIIMFETLTGQIPYKKMSSIAAAHAVAYRGLRPAFPASTCREYVALAQRCWAEDPDDRPTFTEILSILDGLDDPEPLSPEDAQQKDVVDEETLQELDPPAVLARIARQSIFEDEKAEAERTAGERDETERTGQKAVSDSMRTLTDSEVPSSAFDIDLAGRLSSDSCDSLSKEDTVPEIEHSLNTSDYLS